MKKYLVVLQVDVADEGDVGLIKVITQNELEKIKSIHTGFGNIDGRNYQFDKSDAIEITEEEINVLKKFGLTDLEFGYCDLTEEIDEDDEEDDDDGYEDNDDGYEDNNDEDFDDWLDKL